ncbi:hypothetical protein Bbelb_378010 [Branchiostoma belcheri]|nr:hypothetical protein Bbelb_378010 [Branchiostoma belcheri]
MERHAMLAKACIAVLDGDPTSVEPSLRLAVLSWKVYASKQTRRTEPKLDKRNLPQNSIDVDWKRTAGRITSQANSKSKTTARLSRNMHGEPCQIARRHPASLAKDGRFFILVEASRAPVGRCPRSLPDRRGLSANGSEGLLHMNRLNSNKDLLAKLTPALDVFHAYGHKTSCQLKYSTRRLSGFGLTDGESVERMWAYLRRFASTTKEMTASRRVDLLTDALLHYTRRKSSDMELTLKKKLDSARKSECVAQEGLAAVMEDANATRPGWKQDYATKLQKLKAVRLDKELRGIERKRKIIRWTETSEEFLNTMREVDWNTRSSLLSKMHSLAYERSFLASLKRKYPGWRKKGSQEVFRERESIISTFCTGPLRKKRWSRTR